MRVRVVLTLAMALLWCLGASAQQIQPVTYVADLHIKPGKEEEFMKLVKEFNEPMFAKLMAEGAVLAWGLDIPILHQPGAPTHSAWWTTADTSGFDKVFAAFEAQGKKTREEETKAAEEARKKRQAPPKTLDERFQETIDISKHRDWMFRDLVSGFSSTPPPAGAQPYSWISSVRVLPGKGTEYRQLWEKYNKPVYDKLVAQGAIGAYGLGIEEARTTDDFSHFTWVGLPNLAAREKVRAAFEADRQARSAEERRQITQSFLGVIDPAASRTLILRSIIFHVAPPK